MNIRNIKAMYDTRFSRIFIAIVNARSLFKSLVAMTSMLR
jgi:hypothetical protein